MASVAEIAAVGRDPGLVVLVCTDCGTADSVLVYPVTKEPASMPGCRMHGWREGIRRTQGARNGNYKHGRYTAQSMATRRWLRESIRELKALTRTLREQR
jgi:hypothetical protein